MGEERRSAPRSPSRERSSDRRRSHRSRSRSRDADRDRDRDRGRDGRRHRDQEQEKGRDRYSFEASRGRGGRDQDDARTFRRSDPRDDYERDERRRSRGDRDSFEDRRGRDDGAPNRRPRDSPERSPLRYRDRTEQDGGRGREGGERRREERRHEDGRRRDRDRDEEQMPKQQRKEEEVNAVEEDTIDESVLLRMEGGDEQDEAQRVLEESRKRREAIRLKHEASKALAGGKGPDAGRDHPTDLQQSLRFGKPSGSTRDAAPVSRDAFPNDRLPQNGFHGETPGAAGANGPAGGWHGVAAAPADVTRDSPANSAEDGKDMFSDDIFAQSPAGGRQVAKADGAVKDSAGLTDNWDDAEGYYTCRIGEVLDGRYEVTSASGKGVFSTVVRAIDLKAPAGGRREVAIKIIRSNETMFKAGQQELVILQKLAGGDPEDKRHCVRLLSSFQFRGHLCLVFEALEMNLREVLKKYGRNIGIKLSAVRAYATQLFLALKHLRNCGILHCDIKPDNMLVNEAKNVLKLADFGSAMFTGDNEITPYLVSRFYRAPEIMLGLTYDHALDMWSVGCCLYELYTGKMLFPGRNNNDMLRLHIELKGPFPKKLLKKASFLDQHFDSDFNFCALEADPVNPNKTVKRIMSNVKPKDMGSLLPTAASSTDHPRALAAFRDLLDKIFALDPDKRITASQALSHPFILEKY